MTSLPSPVVAVAVSGGSHHVRLRVPGRHGAEVEVEVADRRALAVVRVVAVVDEEGPGAEGFQVLEE